MGDNTRLLLHQNSPAIPGQRLTKPGLQQRLRLNRDKHVHQQLHRTRRNKHVLRGLWLNRHVLKPLRRQSGDQHNHKRRLRQRGVMQGGQRLLRLRRNKGLRRRASKDVLQRLLCPGGNLYKPARAPVTPPASNGSWDAGAAPGPPWVVGMRP